LRAGIKRELADGACTLAELLLDPPAVILKAPIGEVLEWVPGVGPWRCGRILAAGPGSPGVGRMLHVEHLSNASKQRILTRFEMHVPYNVYLGEAAA
jgi:hypothetical protein